MPIDKSDEGWSKEIRAAEQHRDKHMRVAKGLVKKMHTACFSSDHELDQLVFEGDPVNYVYQFVQTIVPQLVFANPVARVTSRRTGHLEALAAANKQCVNRWVKDHKLYRVLREVVTDSFFPFGVMGIMQGSNPWPVPKRIAQDDFIRDPYALTKADLRFTGHRWWADKKAIEERARRFKDEGWILANIRELKEDDGAVRDLRHRAGGDQMQAGPKRGEIVFYDVVVHNEVMKGFDPERFPSTIYTLAITGAGRVKKVRKPRPFFGRGPSPYNIYDYGYVPNDTHGLSPVVANDSQSRSLNDFWRGTLNAMRNYKRLIAVNSGDPDFAAKMRDLGDLTVLEIAGVERNDVIPIELGGITNQHPQTLEMLQQLLDENLGLTDAQKGIVPSDGTATASQIAANSASVRVDDMEQQVYDNTAEALKDVAFYVWDNEDIECPLGREAINEMMEVPRLASEIQELQLQAMQEEAEANPQYAAKLQVALAHGSLTGVSLPELDIVYKGGDREFAPEGSKFEDLELEVQPYSMGRTSQDLGQRRGLELLQLIAQLAQLKAVYPGGAKYDELAQAIGDQMNHPGLASILDTPQDAGAQAPQGGAPGAGATTSGGGVSSGLEGRTSGALAGAAARG